MLKKQDILSPDTISMIFKSNQIKLYLLSDHIQHDKHKLCIAFYQILLEGPLGAFFFHYSTDAILAYPRTSSLFSILNCTRLEKVLNASPEILNSPLEFKPAFFFLIEHIFYKLNWSPYKLIKLISSILVRLRNQKVCCNVIKLEVIFCFNCQWENRLLIIKIFLNDKFSIPESRGDWGTLGHGVQWDKQLFQYLQFFDFH